MVHRSLGLDSSPVTRYGATSSTLLQAGSVLRARAARSGATLKPVSDVDLAAAVIGVDSWMAIFRTDTLDCPAKHGRPAVAALAALLFRAAGLGPDADFVEVSDVSESYLALAAGHARWVVSFIEADEAAVALHKAASDLCAGKGNTQLESLAAAFHIVADDLDVLPLS